MRVQGRPFSIIDGGGANGDDPTMSQLKEHVKPRPMSWLLSVLIARAGWPPADAESA
jgi:hypothetical protein